MVSNLIKQLANLYVVRTGYVGCIPDSPMTRENVQPCSQVCLCCGIEICEKETFIEYGPNYGSNIHHCKKHATEHFRLIESLKTVSGNDYNENVKLAQKNMIKWEEDAIAALRQITKRNDWVSTFTPALSHNV